MKLEAATDLAPRDVIARALADLLGEGWTLRSMSDHHLHLTGRRERDSKLVRAVFLGVLVGFVGLVFIALSDPAGGIGEWQWGEALALYSLVAWPSAIVLLLHHLLAARGEAGVAIAATPHPDGGSIVLAQAYGSALAEEKMEMFVERLQRPGDGSTVRLADRLGPR